MMNLRLSLWSAKMMSVFVLVVGVAVLSENAGKLQVPVVNLEALNYPILVMGAGLILVIWFMYRVHASYQP